MKSLPSFKHRNKEELTIRLFLWPLEKKGLNSKSKAKKKDSGHSSLGQACLCCLSSTELRVQLKIRCKRVVKYCACDHLWMPVMTRVLSLSAPKNPVWKSPFLISSLSCWNLFKTLENLVNLFVCLIGHFQRRTSDHLWMPVMTRVLSPSAPKNPVWKSKFLIFALPW